MLTMIIGGEKTINIFETIYFYKVGFFFQFRTRRKGVANVCVHMYVII